MRRLLMAGLLMGQGWAGACYPNALFANWLGNSRSFTKVPCAQVPQRTLGPIQRDCYVTDESAQRIALTKADDFGALKSIDATRPFRKNSLYDTSYLLVYPHLRGSFVVHVREYPSSIRLTEYFTNGIYEPWDVSKQNVQNICQRLSDNSRIGFTLKNCEYEPKFSLDTVFTTPLIKFSLLDSPDSSLKRNAEYGFFISPCGGGGFIQDLSPEQTRTP